jgi:hypothetical protein
VVLNPANQQHERIRPRGVHDSGIVADAGDAARLVRDWNSLRQPGGDRVVELLALQDLDHLRI